MALFTDAGTVTLEELLVYEASLVDVASSHNINVETKINTAIGIVGDKILLWLLRDCTSDPQWLSRRQLGLTTVVVTPSLMRWLCFEALARFFGEAYNVQLNTRFQGKMTEYQQQAKDAALMYRAAGIGLVMSPLPRPLAPNVSVVNGDYPAQLLFIQTAWVDATGRESALSPVAAVALKDLNTFSVQMADSLSVTPGTAVGWNVYVSSGETNPSRQNATPLAIGTAWPAPDLGLEDGVPPTDGQLADVYVVDPQRIQRG